MYRARRVNRPPLPKTRADIDLQGQWTTTKQDERFLLHQDEDMLIFATDDNLSTLSSATTVFMDGTFKSAPASSHLLPTSREVQRHLLQHV